jgi:hypothetical protein
LALTQAVSAAPSVIPAARHSVIKRWTVASSGISISVSSESPRM